MTIAVPQEQWDELRKVVGVTHGAGADAYLLVTIPVWGSRDREDVRFVVAPRENGATT